MNKRDRLKKVIFATFDKNKIKFEAISQCNEAIQYVINQTPISQEMVETEAYNELKLRGLSEDKLPDLIGKIYQRYSVIESEKRWVLAKESEKAYIKFLVTNLSQIETVLRKHGYEGKIVKIDLVEKAYDPTLPISMCPIYFNGYMIYPEVDNFSVTMKCKGHPSKTVNVELRKNVS